MLIPNFPISDIDSIGLGAGPSEPHDSFQDEIELSAERGGVPVGFNMTALGGSRPVITGPSSVAGYYRVGENHNLGPADPNGTVELSTTEPVTSFSFAYSSGPAEALVEPSATYPAPAPLDPAGNAHSNNHAVRVNTFSACTGTLTIGDLVFADVDGDGVRDPGEPGLPGVTVNLTDQAGNVVDTVTTDANGAYTFTEVVPYAFWGVTVAPPAGYTNTVDRDPTPDGTTVVDNSGGGNVADADFGLEPPRGTISGTVIADRGDDGTLDAGDGDTGLGGVTVTLTGTDLAGNPVSASTVTANDGTYSFPNIAAGDYTVDETQPAVYLDGMDTPGTNATGNGDDSHSITLGLEASSVGNNFAEIPPSDLAGTVYEDDDNGGTQNGAESGIPGATVTLTGTDDGGNTVNLTTTTDGDGDYIFDRLRPGTYVITETQPFPYLDGTDAVGSLGGNDTVNDEFSAITLGLGVSGADYDFGEIPASSIAGSVVDDHGTGIPNATITLTGTDDLGSSVNLSTTTDGNGDYVFAILRPGTYTVTETQPVGYDDGGESAGSVGGDDTVDDVVSNIVLTPGTTATGYDFDEVSSSIAGTVVDDDGVGIVNTTVTLTGIDAAGTLINVSTTTDTNGDYIFEGLLAGLYTVTETQPVGYGDGGESAGTAGGDDTVNDVISAVNLPVGTNATGYDFDETRGSVAGSVFEDTNNDGVQNGAEVGIENVVVTLTGTDDLGNGVSLSTTTDVDGNYSFDDLLSGTYTVTETQPAGFADGIDTAGTAGGDAASVDDEISGVALGGGQNATGYDFAELVPSSIDGTVFEDDDNDGIQDAGEAGIENATVTLTGIDDLGGFVNLSTTTDAGGDYSFPNLRPGMYTVTETTPFPYLDGIDSVGSEGGDGSVNDTVSAIDLATDTIATGYDFGELSPSSISGSVVDDGGNGIPNTTMTLTGTDDLGNPVSATTTTGVDGDYSFAVLRPGTYTVTETQPIGYGDGGETAGSLGGDDSVDDVISAIVLPAATDATDYDFDETRGRIRGTVFEDIDNDGVQDPGEPGIQGVTVTLTGIDDLGNLVSLTRTTNANGRYRFRNLIGGVYTVTESQPAAYLDGIDSAGAVGGDDTSVNDEISAISLPGGRNAGGYDFGELTASSISGSVVDDGGNGIENVIVTLTGTDDLGNPVTAFTVTDVDGDYSFAGLRPGTYTVTETQPIGYGDGGETAGSLGGDDSVDDVISAIVLASATDATGYDFDETRGSIAGTVFEDTNNDGSQFITELGIDNVTVTLTGVDDLGNLVSLTTTTDVDGRYSFDDLISGTYTVTETQPGSHLDGIDTAGTAGGDDTSVNDEISAIALSGGENATGYDFGELQASSVSGSVVDDGGNGIPNTTITLSGTDDLGNPVLLTTTTDVGGGYSFAGLRPGTYTVTETQPIGYGDGGETAGSIGGDDSVNDVISAIVLASATDATGYDFDETRGSISGTVFEDANNDGSQFITELGIDNVTVTLTGFDDLGNVVSLTTTTDVDGRYSFDDLISGAYTVTETQPTGYFDGIDTAGTAGGDDTSINDEISAIALSGGDDATGYDFGELVPSSIAGSVFDDVDNNGAQDTGELGIENVTVTLTGTDDLGNPVNLTATTDVDGDYRFDDLRPGDYTVTETQPVDFNDGIDTAGTSGGDDTTVNDEISGIVLAPATDATDYDFAELAPSSISGSVVDDFANPIENVTVTLTGTDDLGNPVNLTATTDVDGEYRFDDLLPGDYSVTETQPVGYADGGEVAGSVGGDDSVDDVVSAIVLDAGVDATGYDFDETTGSIAGTVFHDADQDGTQGSGDTGIEGVNVTLTGTDDLGNLVSLTTTTGADGGYLFENLISGTYTVIETQPAHYADGADLVGTAGGDNSVNDEVSGIVLAAGSDETDYDFGELGYVISGTTWVDTDRDGVIDPEETNELAGVTVTLLDADGNVVATTETDANGAYEFPPVAAGEYTVVQGQPSQYASSTPNELTVTVVDDDVPGNNFGEHGSTVAGRVWDDLDGDGVDDANEPGVAEVTVNLLDADGNVVATTTTGPDGSYRFDDVLPGDYEVEFERPDGKVLSPQDAGDDGVDSDPDIVTGRVPVSVSVGEDVTDIDAGMPDAENDLAIELTVDDPNPSIGDELVYTIAVTNTGNGPVDGVVVNQVLPPNTTFVSATGEGWECTHSGQEVECVYTGVVLPGEELPPISVVATADSAGTFVTTATVEALDGTVEVTETNNADQVTVTVATASSSGPSGPLAFTGASTAQLVQLALVLLTLGALLVGATRFTRRREQ
ncbi:MAG: SdrD B-like domain-containing protein [Acidimicrobiales bacterium]